MRLRLLFPLAVCGLVCAPIARANVVDKGPEISMPLVQIPQSAQIVYVKNGHVWVADAVGRNETQITPEPPRLIEHVAVSFNRRFVVTNEQKGPLSVNPGGLSSIWIYDLVKGTEAQIVPDFVSAGNGGVTWDANGFIYFGGHEASMPGPDDPLAAGPNDIYRIRYDGTSLQRIVTTPTAGEADVGISNDGRTITYVAQPLGADFDEIWIAHSDGTGQRRLYRGGRNGVASAHDPEPSDDGSLVAFSIVDSQVPPNCSQYPWANTAHNLWVMRADGRGRMTRITRPGSISIVPNWSGSRILYTDLDCRDNYTGAAIVRGDRVDQRPDRILNSASAPKWIP